MKYLQEKNKYVRLNFLKIEKKRHAIKFLTRSWLLDDKSRCIVQNQLSSFCKKFSYVKIKNRCLFSNRSKGVIRSEKMSRIKFRELISLGLLPNYKKAVW
mmetsp:Transcript_531/g.1760  ORF Transcript_531/g.1760 Transcript_531/m.1760 type:complete len:100 (-) Transcript_531:1017-1316(-)